MAVRNSFGVLLIFIVIVCQTSSWPQSYSSRRNTPERREDEPRSSPTNEVYSSQLHQPTSTTTSATPRGTFERRQNTTPPTPVSHGGKARPGVRQNVVKVSSSTIQVAGWNHSDGSVHNGHLTHHNASVVTGVLLDLTNMTREAALDKAIQEVFESPRMGVSNSGNNNNKYYGSGINSHPSSTMADDKIVFPTRSGSIVFPTVAPSYTVHPVEPCPDGQSFCDNVPNYPDIYLASHLHKTKAYDTLFGRDEITIQNVTQRIDIPDDQPLCSSVESVVYPKLGQNMDDSWLYIVNVPGKQQGVRVETCSGMPEKECEYSHYMYGYQSFCKQKYISRTMVILNPDNGEVQRDSIKLPACCSCHVRQIDVASTRSGFDASTMSKAPKSRRRRDRRIIKNHRPLE